MNFSIVKYECRRLVALVIIIPFFDFKDNKFSELIQNSTDILRPINMKITLFCVSRTYRWD